MVTGWYWLIIANHPITAIHHKNSSIISAGACIPRLLHSLKTLHQFWSWEPRVFRHLTSLLSVADFDVVIDNAEQLLRQHLGSLGSSSLTVTVVKICHGSHSSWSACTAELVYPSVKSLDYLSTSSSKGPPPMQEGAPAADVTQVIAQS